VGLSELKSGAAAGGAGEMPEIPRQMGRDIPEATHKQQNQKNPSHRHVPSTPTFPALNYSILNSPPAQAGMAMPHAY
jgi:hypothetical protein